MNLYDSGGRACAFRPRPIAGIDRSRLAVAVLCLLSPPFALGYSIVPMSVEDVADLAPCVIEGDIVAQEAKRIGAGIFTEHVVNVTRSAGVCPGRGGTVTVRTFGGRLANGELMRIEGLEPLPAGGPWVMLLQPSGAGTAELVAGPQGAIRLSAVAGKRFSAMDAAGNAVVLARDAKSGASRLVKRGAAVVDRWREQAKSGAGEAEAAKSEFDGDAIFSAAAGRITSKSASDRNATRNEVLAKLAGERPGFIAVGDAWLPLPAAVAAAPAQAALRTVELNPDGTVARETRSGEAPAAQAPACVQLPVGPGETPTRECAPDGSKYSTVGFADRAWNPFPPSFGSWYQVDQAAMVEWNRYADHFRVLVTPTGSFGNNFYNDVGGWPTSDQLLGIYGKGWDAGVLGVTKYYSWCSEITREYILGIFIREYCSQTTYESDVFLNPAYTWTYDDLPARLNTTAAFSARETLLHELGHGFGLGHSTQMAIMRTCNTRLGWLPYPDDVAGARAIWPGKARYGPSLNVRLVQAGSGGACFDGQGHSTGMSMYNAPVWTDGSQVNVGPFLLENFDSTPRAGAAVEWYLTRNASNFAPGTYAYLGTTQHGTIPPGGTVVPGAVLPLPSASFGRGYVTAYVREGAGSANVDSSPSSLYACVGMIGAAPLDAGPALHSYLGPADCSENARNFVFDGVAGQPERIDMRSPQFDTLMRLYGPDGTEIAMNDDFGGTLNSRIERVLPATGAYRVYATSYGGSSMGDFTLQRAMADADDDGDGLPNGDEVLEGRNGTVKDNDLFSPGAGSARLFVMQQYRDFLGRRGDASGVEGWTNALVAGTADRSQVINAFLSSEEFGGAVAPLLRLYFATYQRVPDYGGLVFNAGLVRNGTVTLPQLADFFTTSPEFIALYGALDNTQFVTLLYQNVLGRAPDQTGLDGWVGVLNGGLSRGQVMLGFSESTEYQAAKSNEVYVTMMYVGMLRRSPETGGYDSWLAYLDTPGNTPLAMINGFYLSTEYHNRFLP